MYLHHHALSLISLCFNSKLGQSFLPAKSVLTKPSQCGTSGLPAVYLNASTRCVFQDKRRGIHAASHCTTSKRHIKRIQGQAMSFLLLTLLMLWETPEVRAAPVYFEGSIEVFQRKVNQGRSTNAYFQAARSDSPMEAEITRQAVTKEQREILKVLYAYMEEIERNIFARKWETVYEYTKVFARQESVFLSLIENAFPSAEDFDREATAAITHEVQAIFLYLDDLTEATAFRDAKKAEKAYVGLAIAYDRLLKAGDLYDAYDNVNSFKLYENIPENMLVFDREVKPRVPDEVLVIAGPDKGRLGRLIGISDAPGKAVVRIIYGVRSPADPTYEVKVLDYTAIAKKNSDAVEDSQMKDLLMCPNGLSFTLKGISCKE